ncbi:GTPase family protein [Demequina soli]|uniref:GTPase family protein n=1 Tax=Demequina soli TaxID=1638987 RepID=UPI0007845560|nr:GTPase [Demequina soli]
MTDNQESAAGAREDDEVAQIDPEALHTALREERARIGRFNLAIVGGTGVGKSSLVNAVFGEGLAPTGVGLPVTRGVQYYTNADASLGIWDFEGFEIGKVPGDLVRENLQVIEDGPREKHISAVWYCVTSSADRLTQPDIDQITAFAAGGLPVIVVLTKTIRARDFPGGKWKPSAQVEAFAEWIASPFDHQGEAIELPIAGIALTAAVDQGKHGGPAHGLGELLDMTLALAPDEAQEALVVAQRLSLPLKRALARKAIVAAGTASAAAAATPIPVADAVALAPIQLGMMGRIAAVYQLDLKVMMSAQAIAQLAVQVVGRALARSLIKLIPAVGTVINATVASALTTATGEGWLRLCEAVYSGKVALDQVEKVWKDFAPTAVEVINAVLKARVKGGK